MGNQSSVIKIVLIGDPATGKTSYCHQLQNLTSDTPPRAPQVPFNVVTIQVPLDNVEVPVQIYNIAGSQLGKTSIRRTYQKLDGFIIMFDVTKHESYDDVIQWYRNLNTVFSTDTVPSILIANKIDLEQDEEMRGTLQTIDEFAQVLKFVACFQTSMVTGQNVRESMERLVREIVKKRKEIPAASLTPPQPSTNEPRDLVLKLICIGDMGTGKTSIIKRYTNNRFDSAYKYTIGVDFSYKIIKYDERTIIRVQLWDIGGQERIMGLTRSFYKDAVGCLLCYDVTKPITLTDGAVKWKKDLDDKHRLRNGDGIPCLLIANKCDLEKRGEAADSDFVDNFSRTHRFLHHFELSARTNQNVSTSIKFLIDHIVQNDSTAQLLTGSYASIKICDLDFEQAKQKNCFVG